MAPGLSEELSDVVDEEDRVVGIATRSEIRRRKLRYRCACVLCRNPAGDYFVHRRTMTKDVFPGLYDMFVAGTVLAGESYEAAAVRELEEELGISGPAPTFLFKHLYMGPENPSWNAIFELTWDGPIRIQTEEIAWGGFMSEEELVGRIEEGDFVPDGVEVFKRYLESR